MNKTQTTLIAKATQHGGSGAIECGGGRGPLGGRVSYGSRERDALFALVEAGKATITSRDSQDLYDNGYCVRTTVINFALS